MSATARGSRRRSGRRGSLLRAPPQRCDRRRGAVRGWFAPGRWWMRCLCGRRALGGRDLQVDRVDATKAAGLLIDPATEAVVGPQRSLRALLIGGGLEYARVTVGGRAEGLAADGGWSNAHAGVVADPPHFGDVRFASDVELAVGEPEPHPRP